MISLELSPTSDSPLTIRCSRVSTSEGGLAGRSVDIDGSFLNRHCDLILSNTLFGSFWVANNLVSM